MEILKHKKTLWTIELIWWIITALVIGLVLFHMYSAMENHKFVYQNIIFIIVAITFSRFIFLTQYTPYLHYIPIKGILALACVPLAFYLIESIQDFKQYFDQEEGLLGFEKYFTPSSTFAQRQSIFEFFRVEYMWFGVSAVVSTFILPIRMVKSIWRSYNKTGEI